MFQFSGFATLARCHAFSVTGYPIRIPADHKLFAPPRSFSQLITSFFASESLGIHRVPLFTFFTYDFLDVLNIFFQYVKELFILLR